MNLEGHEVHAGHATPSKFTQQPAAAQRGTEESQELKRCTEELNIRGTGTEESEGLKSCTEELKPSSSSTEEVPEVHRLHQ